MHFNYLSVYLLYSHSKLQNYKIEHIQQASSRRSEQTVQSHGLLTLHGRLC